MEQAVTHFAPAASMQCIPVEALLTPQEPTPQTVTQPVPSYLRYPEMHLVQAVGEVQE